MTEQQIRFDDGAAYERMMGTWSRLAGEIFIDWLAPRSGLRWIDIGCDNGAFTELLVERCAPLASMMMPRRSSSGLLDGEPPPRAFACRCPSPRATPRQTVSARPRRSPPRATGRRAAHRRE